MPAVPTSALTILLHGVPTAPQQPRLGAALAARGHRVIVCDAHPTAATIRGEHGQRCEELTVNAQSALIPKALLRWWAQRRTAELSVDVVHLNFIRPWHDVWSTMRGGPPIVATAWGSDINDEVFKKPERDLRRINHVLSTAAAITADSVPLLAKATARAGPTSEAASGIVFWGVDLAMFDRQSAREASARCLVELGIAPGQRVLLSPRQTKPHYHIDRILRGFAASRWRAVGALVLKLHGRPEEEPYVKQLMELSRELGVADRVKFAGPRPYADLPALYAAADAAVSALEMDGVPSTFFELMALGVPIVASDLSAYEAVLENGVTALTAPPADEGALVGALNRLLDEPALGPALAERAMVWAKKHADWERCVDQFESFYRAAVLTGRGKRGMGG